ncbi:MAG: dihydropteroate synthase [Halodesulfurarchaeum sp.]
MDYAEAASYLLTLRRFRTKLGTDSTRRFLERLGNPDHGIPAVQIAGSNGKGSTARMLARILEETGLRVGLYTSPHLEDFRERIRVDGRMIPKSAITEFVSESRDFIDRTAANGDPLTHFEVLTSLALWYFDRRSVDVMVLEVGIGGRYDATSVVDPVASAVTNVSLEHTDIIGSTVEEIARDKAHVAPENGPLVSAAHGVLDVLEERSPVISVGGPDSDVVVESSGRRNHVEQEIDIRGEGWQVHTRIPHLGPQQVENAGIAATLARQVTRVSEEDIAGGLRKADWPGRFEILQYDPFVVLDGAHNPGAIEYLADALSDLDYDDLVLVFGAMHDKDHGTMIETLPSPEKVFTCRPDEERAEDEGVLAASFERQGVDDVEAIRSVPEAVEAGLARVGPEDCLLVTGSLYTVSEARQRFTRAVISKSNRLPNEAQRNAERTSLDSTAEGHEESRRRHERIKTRLQRDQARAVQETMLRCGGDCVVSDLIDQARFVDVLLSGTLSDFECLIDRIASAGLGLGGFAADLESTIHANGDAVPENAPWTDTPAIMGILNVTPDSFHDGGEFDTETAAVEQAEALVDAGADIVDVGGESTRPGADPVSVETELDRVIPVVQRLQDLDAAISIDTRRPDVAEAAIETGADVVNDVSGLDDPDMRYVVAEYDVPVVLMHSITTPVDPSLSVTYDDVVEDVIRELTERIMLAEQAGIDRENIIVDPGIGFGKSKAENFELLDRLSEFEALGCPILVGHSHKSLYGALGYEEDDRLLPTVAVSALAAERGAAILRVHDVAENLSAVRTADAIRSGGRTIETED